MQIQVDKEGKQKLMQLNDSMKSLANDTMSYELNSKGLKVAREDFQID
jgi:hypothetical protein